MAKLLLFLVALFYLILPAESAVETDGTASIASGANTIALGGLYGHVIVKLSSGSSSVYCTINHGATASSSDFLIDSGSTLSFGISGQMSPTDQINYYGNGTTGTISWTAW